MKKFFCSLLFMAMAIVSAVSFVSCGSDDDPVEEAYFKYACWVSNDVLDLADVVAEGVNISLNTPATYRNIDGKEGTVELTGKAATDANFTISFKLKSNWKEILANKDVVVVAYASAHGTSKDEAVKLDTNFVLGGSFSRESVRDDFETTVSERITRTVLRSK